MERLRKNGSQRLRSVAFEIDMAKLGAPRVDRYGDPVGIDNNSPVRHGGKQRIEIGHA
jgi:citrate lyase alpha subunit